MKRSFSAINWDEKLKEQQVEKPIEPKYIEIKEPEEPQKPILKTPGLFNKKKVIAENNLLEARYAQQMDEYAKMLEKLQKDKETNKQLKTSYNKEMCFYKEALKAAKDSAKIELDEQIEALMNDNQSDIEPPSSQQLVDFITNEESVAFEKLEKLATVLNQLHSYNIIHPKYRNLPALYTFYEYIDTRRCLTLEGPDGAYNLYESEQHENLVNAKLDTIINNLEANNLMQMLMYEELKKIEDTLSDTQALLLSATKQLEKINDNTKNMSKSLNRISEDTAMTAYNTAVTAQYTILNSRINAAIGFMLAMQ